MQTGLPFGVDQRFVFVYFEHAAARAHQLDIGTGKFPLDSRLQLESPGSVTSGVAVFDADVHTSLHVLDEPTYAAQDMQEADRPRNERGLAFRRGLMVQLFFSFLGGERSIVATPPPSSVQFPT